MKALCSLPEDFSFLSKTAVEHGQIFRGKLCYLLDLLNDFTIKGWVAVRAPRHRVMKVAFANVYRDLTHDVRGRTRHKRFRFLGYLPRQPGEHFDWVGASRRSFLSKRKPARPRPLLRRVASGFHGRNAPVHIDNILAGLARTRVKLIVIEKEGCGFRRKRQDEVRNSRGGVPLLQ